MEQNVYPSNIIPEMEITTANGIAKCRLCNTKIPKNEERLIIWGVHVSPRIVDLHFHVDCMREAFSVAYRNWEPKQ